MAEVVVDGQADPSPHHVRVRFDLVGSRIVYSSTVALLRHVVKSL